ncbi:hypothetical protein CHUAL_002906 [Chamberlinius hualienensis]
MQSVVIVQVDNTKAEAKKATCFVHEERPHTCCILFPSFLSCFWLKKSHSLLIYGPTTALFYKVKISASKTEIRELINGFGLLDLLGH